LKKLFFLCFLMGKRKRKSLEFDEVLHTVPVRPKHKDAEMWAKEVEKLRPTKENPLPAPVVKSTFKVKFPQYREMYIKKIWKEIVDILKNYGVGGSLDLVEGELSVFTTSKMWDPWAIMNARDFIRLVARGVTVLQSRRVFSDDIFCDIINLRIKKMKTDTFIRRRQRLMGPKGTTLKALELLTACYILIQGKTVAALGPAKGIKTVRKLVVNCMKNIHPIYEIKRLMIMRELARNPELAEKDWSRFLPKFKKKNVKRKKKPKKDKGPRNPFAPPQTPRKVDLQMLSGEYWDIKKAHASRLKAETRLKIKLKAEEKREEKRLKKLKPPEEKNYEAEDKDTGATPLDKLTENLKVKGKIKKQNANSSAKSFVLSSIESEGDSKHRKKKKAKKK